MTFEQTPGGSGPGSPGDEADVGEVVTMVDVLQDGRDMEENAKVLNSKCNRVSNNIQISGSARGCLRECLQLQQWLPFQVKTWELNNV